MSILIQVTEESNRQGTNNPFIQKLYGVPNISLIRDNGTSASIIIDGRKNNEERIVSESYETIKLVVEEGYIDFVIPLTQLGGRKVLLRASNIIEAYNTGTGKPRAIVRYRDNDKTEDDLYTLDQNISEILDLVPPTGGGDNFFDWNRPITGLPSIGQTPGGLTTAEGLNAIFYPFVEATLSLNSFSKQEEGAQFFPKLRGLLTPNQETIINSRIVQVDGVDADTFSSNTINQSAPTFITADTTYRLKSNVRNNGSPIDIFSPARTVDFVFPFFYGTSNEAVRADVFSNTNFYTDGTKVVNSGSGNINIPFSGTGFLWFAIKSSEPVKTTWFESLLNNGSIGSPSDLFDAPTIEIVNSTGLFNDYSENYNIYVTNFQTTGATLLIS